MHNMAWADHAFHASSSLFSSWSIQEYRHLRYTAASLPGIRHFASYRLAYSWALLSDALRQSAIERLCENRAKARISDLSGWDHLYEAADESLRIAIAHNERLLQSIRHPVL